MAKAFHHVGLIKGGTIKDRQGTKNFRLLPIIRAGDSTKLEVFKFLRRGEDSFSINGNNAAEANTVDDYEGYFVPTVTDATKGGSIKPIPRGIANNIEVEDADLIVIGGGVAGLSAAITAAELINNETTTSNTKANNNRSIVLLEAASEVGGRVKSETTEDGFTLDHGFAVFIDAYPEPQKLLDFDNLNLKSFLPGALIKVKDHDHFARVADPLREPGDILNSILAPIGTIGEKLDVVPLYLNTQFKSISDLFEEPETNTETALKERWNLSDTIIERFFKPFLEGIYLAPLSKQSSRMLSFVLKMFIDGSATLPEGGIGTVAAQLSDKAKNLGVNIKTNAPVSRIELQRDGSFIVENFAARKRFRAKSVVVATDGRIAQKMLSTIDGFENLLEIPEQPNVSVGCLYYSFKGNAPIEDPILILNGIGEEGGSDGSGPVNNICFPSVVNKGYAPDGYTLCSVSVLGDAMDTYKGRPEELDEAVRKQLGTWFPDRRVEILEDWELKKIFFVSTQWSVPVINVLPKYVPMSHNLPSSSSSSCFE